MDSDAKTVTYRQRGVDLLTVLKSVPVYLNGKTYSSSNLYALINSSSHHDHITYTWTNEADNKEVEGNAPSKVGTYTVTIKDSDETTHQKISDVVITGIKIVPAKVTVTLNASAAPGTLAKDSKLQFEEASASDGMGFDEKDLKFTVTNYRRAINTDAEFNENTILENNDDYILDVKAEFVTDPASNAKGEFDFNNYTIADIAPVKLQIGELISTQITIIDPSATDPEKKLIDEIHIPYVEGQKAQIKDTDCTITVQAEDDKGEWADLKAVPWAEILDITEKTPKEIQDIIKKDTPVTGRWYSDKFDEDTDDRISLDAVPEDAGTYYYRISYDPDDKIHAQTVFYLTVIIDPVDIIIKPVESIKDKEFLEHMSVQNVLVEADYTVLKKEDNTEMKIDRDHFWGNSYADTGATQPYAPVWKLQKKVGSAKWTDCESDEKLVKADDISYQLVFSGDKAVYTADGKLSHPTGINTVEVDKDLDAAIAASIRPDTNYRVDVEESVKYVVPITVKASEAATINVSDIIALNESLGLKGTTDTTKLEVSRDYNGESLFANRGVYKQAKIDEKSSDKLADFTYEWEISAAEDLANKAIWDYNAANMENYNGMTFDASWNSVGQGNYIPRQAGIYRLKISYTDPDLTHYAQPAYVYYVIGKNKIQVVPTQPETDSEKENFEVWAGTTVRSFLRDGEREFPNTVWAYPSTEGAGALEEWEKYTVDWEIVEISSEGSKVLDASDSFRAEQGVTYQLRAKDLHYYGSLEKFLDRNNTCFEYEAVPASEADPVDPKEGAKRAIKTRYNTQTVNITVKKMGTKQLTIEVGDLSTFTYGKEYDGKPFDFDVKTALEKGWIVLKDETGTKVTEDLQLQVRYEYTETDEDGNYREYSVSNAVNAQNYKLHVYFEGTENTETNPGWTPTNTEIADIEIRARILTINTSQWGDTITVPAGKTAYTVLNDSKLSYFNYALLDFDEVETDSHAFTWDGSLDWKGFSAWRERNNSLYRIPLFKICNEDGSVENGKLKSGRNYYLEYADTYRYWDSNKNESVTVPTLSNPYNKNYKVKLDKKVSVVAEPGDAEITAEYDIEHENGTIKGLHSSSKKTAGVDGKPDSYTLKVLEGIPYSDTIYYSEYDGGYFDRSNLVAVTILAPEEFTDTDDLASEAIYRDQIKEAGGIFHGFYEETNQNDNVIRVGLQAVFDAAKGNTSFKLRWRDGFVEEFVLDFSKAELLLDPQRAVAPKSVAFNAPNKKMAIGEVQQLDVKVTKAQMDDLVYLNYRIKDSNPADVLTVNKKTGEVTALKLGTSTVEVYPVRWQDGEYVQIDGAKTASVKITVKDVTAPKIKKVTPLDTSATVKYGMLPDGYRREVYVLEGKKTVADFEGTNGKIAELQNAKWQDIFAIAPKYYETGAELRLQDSAKLPTITLKGLKANTEYTVYVGNVSGVRTLEDGSQVTASMKGSVKTFKTTRQQVKGLILTMDTESHLATVTESVYEPVYWAEFMSKGVQVSVEGKFYEDYADSTSDMEVGSYDWIDVKDKAKMSAYQSPALTYSVWDRDTWNPATGRYGIWSSKNAYISIDKKGKIKLNGVSDRYEARIDARESSKNYDPGRCADEDVDGHTPKDIGVEPFVIRVRDENTGVECIRWLHVTATADSVAATKKKVDLQAGQTEILGDLLTYKENKKAIKGYFDYAIDDAVRATIDAEEEFESTNKLNMLAIKAVDEGGEVDLSLTDTKLTGSSAQQIKVTSSAPQAVKGLTVYDVVDTQLKIKFQHNKYAKGYRVKIQNIKDGKTNTIEDIYRSWNDIRNGKDGWWYDDIPNKDGSYTVYYHVEDKDSNNTRLTKQTQYTITVTAVYEEAESKPVSKKVKTTKMPAWDDYQSSSIYDTGGMPIAVSQYGDIDDAAFVSGNTYTLTASGVDNRAKLTDTLTWTSSNKKVATVKSGAGSFSASLKALKPGKTIIEVKSKIWKGKVIARYGIEVFAIGNAYRGNKFLGENEGSTPEDGSDLSVDESRELYLGKDGRRKASIYKEFEDIKGELTYGRITTNFTFKAPETGKYSFHSYGENVYVSGYISGAMRADFNGCPAETRARWLTKGDKCFINVYPEYVYNNATEYYVGVELEQSINKVDDDGTLTISNAKNDSEYFSFTADEDAYYRFHAPASGNGEYTVYVYDTEGHATAGGSTGRLNMVNGWCYIPAGTVCGYVSGIQNKSTTLTVTKNQELAVGTAKNVTCTGGEYFSFKADADGYYQFYSENAASAVTARIGNASSKSEADGKNFFVVYEMKAGDVEYLRVDANSIEGTAPSIHVKKVDVSLEMDAAAKEKEMNLSLEAGKDAYISFTAPKNGYYYFNIPNASNSISITFTDTTDIKLGSVGIYREMKTGEKVYLKLSSGSVDEDIVLHVSDATPEGMNAGDTVSGNLEILRTFTAKEAGYYEFTLSSAGIATLSLYTSMSNKDKNKPISSVSSTVGEDGQYNGLVQSGEPERRNGEDGQYNGTLGLVMQADETVYIVAKISDPNVEMQVSVTKGNNNASISEDEDLKADIEAGKAVWKSFTADKNGVYNFTFSPAGDYNGINIGLCRSYISETPDNSVFLKSGYVDYSSQALTYSMEAGESIWLYAKATADTVVTSVNMRVTCTNEFFVLSEGKEPETIALTAGKDAWVRFTPAKDGVYRFKMSANSNAYAYLYKDYNGSRLDYCDLSNDSVLVYNLQAGVPVWLKLSLSSKSGKVDVSVDMKTPVSLIYGDSWNGTLMPNEKEWIQFTAPRDGIYYFQSNSISYRNEGVVSNYGEDALYTDAYLGTHYSSSFGLAAGESKWLYVKNNSSSASMDISVNIVEKEDTVLYKDAPKDISLSSLAEKWYIFRAPQDGTYVFNITETSGSGSLWGCLYNSYDGLAETHKTGSSIRLSKTLKSEDFIWLKVKNMDSGNENISLYVSLKETINLSAGGEGSLYTISSGEPEWAHFVADEEGLYCFSVSSNSNTTVYLCETSGSTDAIAGIKKYPYQEKPCTISYYLERGKDVWLYTSTTSSSDVVIKASVTVETLDLTVGENKIEKTATLGANENTWARFTATEDGIYAFKFKGNNSLNGGLCKSYFTGNAPSYLDDGYSFSAQSNSIFYRQLNKDEAVWLYVSSNASNNSVTLSVETVDWENNNNVISSTEENKNTKDLVLNGVGVNLVKFKAPADGTYNFTFSPSSTGSTSASTVFVGLCSSTSDVYSSDKINNQTEQTLNSKNVILSQELKKDDVIWCYVRNTSTSDATITLTVTATDSDSPDAETS